jgi:hypothetical protein
MSYEYLKQFMNDKTKDVTDFNVSITDQINNILKDTSAEGFVIRGSLNSGFADNGPKPVSLWNSIKEYFRNKKKFQEEREYEDEQEKFDVIGFFSDIAHNLLGDGALLCRIYHGSYAHRDNNRQYRGGAFLNL